MSATSAPASCASMAARIPAQPAPTTSTSCFASTAADAIGSPCPGGGASQPELHLAALPSGARRVLRIDRHRLGPRVYVLGARVHEWHLGVALLVALALGGLAHRVDDDLTTVAAAVAGVWLVAKDWGALFPAPPPTAPRRPRLPVPAQPLQAVRRSDPLPRLAALTAALAGLVNLGSAVEPDIAWRNHLLLYLEPFEALTLTRGRARPRLNPPAGDRALPLAPPPECAAPRAGAARRLDRARPPEGPRRRGGSGQRRRGGRAVLGTGVCLRVPRPGHAPNRALPSSRAGR